MAKNKAKTKLDPGPAKAVKEESRLGDLKLRGFTGTGFPQPI